MKAKLEFDKHSFETKIQELQSKLKEPDQFDMEKTQSKTLDGKSGMGGSSSQTEFSNPAALLKLRLQRWVQTNKEKKHLMDMYIRNVNIIKDAFEQIKDNTGISSIEEIVTTFIKAEEQNHSLRNYINVIESEIDTIDEQNRNIENEIRRHEELGSANEK